MNNSKKYPSNWDHIKLHNEDRIFTLKVNK